jgi:UDP-glucose 4-epimerase
MDLVNPQYPITRHRKHDIRQTLPSNNTEFDCVIHLAALVNVSQSETHPTDYYMTNFCGTLNVMNTVKFKHFILASTGAAKDCKSVYGTSKKAAEDCVREWCTYKKVPYSTFRFYNVIGSDGFKPTNPDGLMANLIKAKETGEFTIHGNDYNTVDGTCVRDYVHVNEICSAIRTAIDNPTNSLHNLGHGVGHTVKEMVEIFGMTNDVTINITYGPRRAGDLETSVLDNVSPYMEQKYEIDELLLVDNIS